MFKNVGILDRALRTLVGLALIAYALGYIAPGFGYPSLGWIGVILVATGLAGACPIYRVLGLSTCPMHA